MQPLNQLNPVSVSCSKCKKRFDNDEQMHTYKNKFFHDKCFYCNFCDKTLAGLTFFTKPDGSLQCQECHEYHIPRCFVCEQQIPDGVKYNVYQGKHFHKTCFKCIKCQAPIGEGQSFVDSKEGLICMNCAQAKKSGK